MTELYTTIVWNDPNSRADHGIKGQKWGERKYQNKDGSLTPAGIERYRRESNYNQLTTHIPSQKRIEKMNLKAEKAEAKALEKAGKLGGKRARTNADKARIDAEIAQHRYDVRKNPFADKKEVNDLIREGIKAVAVGFVMEQATKYVCNKIIEKSLAYANSVGAGSDGPQIVDKNGNPVSIEKLKALGLI